MLKLHALTRTAAIFADGAGRIIAKPLDTNAAQVLNWYRRNIPAND